MSPNRDCAGVSSCPVLRRPSPRHAAVYRRSAVDLMQPSAGTAIVSDMNYSSHEASAADHVRGPGREAAEALMTTVPRAMRQIRAIARSEAGGLWVPQFRALRYLERRPGDSLTALSDHLGVSLPAASALVDRLVGSGLVTRAADPSDAAEWRSGSPPRGTIGLRPPRMPFGPGGSIDSRGFRPRNSGRWSTGSISSNARSQTRTSSQKDDVA